MLRETNRRPVDGPSIHLVAPVDLLCPTARYFAASAETSAGA